METEHRHYTRSYDFNPVSRSGLFICPRILVRRHLALKNDALRLMNWSPTSSVGVRLTQTEQGVQVDIAQLSALLEVQLRMASSRLRNHKRNLLRLRPSPFWWRPPPPSLKLHQNHNHDHEKNTLHTARGCKRMI